MNWFQLLKDRQTKAFIVVLQLKNLNDYIRVTSMKSSNTFNVNTAFKYGSSEHMNNISIIKMDLDNELQMYLEEIEEAKTKIRKIIERITDKKTANVLERYYLLDEHPEKIS